jgi:serine/threonine-protein kinase
MSRKGFQLAKGVHVPGTKWLLVREIARGGMGVTWEVVKHPGIRGVMKMILPSLAANATYVRRFLEEVEILTKLNHPNIVQVFDFDTLEDGTPFFVMERLEGKTLGAAMGLVRGGARVRKAFPARVAYEITRQTCEALYRAHSLQPRAVVHRDLKPENIYIHQASFGGEPVIKLLDFGVAAFEQAARETGPVGTPRYMAPEQLRCEAVTPKADLYSMGLVLYEMLVGRGPFDHLADAVGPGQRALVLVNAHLSVVPLKPSRYAPWIPATIDDLLLSALDKDPENRPISAYAFVAKLFELQFVNDGTTQRALDANKTTPTLGHIIEDEPAESEARSPRQLANDTVHDLPPSFDVAHTLAMGVDPYGHTTPDASPREETRMPIEQIGGIDRNAVTRASTSILARRPTPKFDTVPSNSRELLVPEAPVAAPPAVFGGAPLVHETAPMQAPEETGGHREATPLTSEVPAQALFSHTELGLPSRRSRSMAWQSAVVFAALLPLGALGAFFATQRPAVTRSASASEAAPEAALTLTMPVASSVALSSASVAAPTPPPPPDAEPGVRLDAGTPSSPLVTASGSAFSRDALPSTTVSPKPPPAVKYPPPAKPTRKRKDDGSDLLYESTDKTDGPRTP